MFSGFDTSVVDVGETTIFIRRKGGGRPLLLLHGFPQTHLMWHRVAPALAEEFTVICADLRGYGASGKPPSKPDHAPYSKTAMALDMVRMVEAQGFSRFSVIGHDRGARVAYRMALDHPERIERLALFDIIPTGEAFHRADARLALAYWPWSLLAQPEPLPERLIMADPAIVVDDALGRSERPTSKRCATRRRCTRSARNTEPPPTSTFRGIRTIGASIAESRVRRSSSGARAAGWIAGTKKPAGR
jgi:haloacetate dehalogenase